jgi:hypothetical protein
MAFLQVFFLFPVGESENAISTVFFKWLDDLVGIFEGIERKNNNKKAIADMVYSLGLFKLSGGRNGFKYITFRKISK